MCKRVLIIWEVIRFEFVTAYKVLLVGLGQSGLLTVLSLFRLLSSGALALLCPVGVLPLPLRPPTVLAVPTGAAACRNGLLDKTGTHHGVSPCFSLLPC